MESRSLQGVHSGSYGRRTSFANLLVAARKGHLNLMNVAFNIMKNL